MSDEVLHQALCERRDTMRRRLDAVEATIDIIAEDLPAPVPVPPSEPDMSRSSIEILKTSNDGTRVLTTAKNGRVQTTIVDDSLLDVEVLPKRSTPKSAANRKRKTEPTDAVARKIWHVITRLGRFAYIDQIERELLRDGHSLGDDLGPYVRWMASKGSLVRVRYNGSNRCTAYGLDSFIEKTGELTTIKDDCHALGPVVDRGRVEISTIASEDAEE